MKEELKTKRTITTRSMRCECCGQSRKTILVQRGNVKPNGSFSGYIEEHEECIDCGNVA